MNSKVVVYHRSLTWIVGAIVGPQICAGGGGGGGIPPTAPGNQDVEGRGSAATMVISGRLATDKQQEGDVADRDGCGRDAQIKSVSL